MIKYPLGKYTIAGETVEELQNFGPPPQRPPEDMAELHINKYHKWKIRHHLKATHLIAIVSSALPSPLRVKYSDDESLIFGMAEATHLSPRNLSRYGIPGSWLDLG